MSETRTRLIELCSAKAIDRDLVDQSRDLTQVLDRTLAECERRVASDPATDPRELVALVELARTTLTLQSSGASLEESTRAAEALDRVDRDLNEAQARSERLQKDLNDTLDDLEAAGLRSVDTELLGELFVTLSKLCHKINNPLTSIMGRAQILQLKCKDGSDAQLAKSVGVIEDSARRVAALVQEQANLICQAKKEFTESYDSSSGSR